MPRRTTRLAALLAALSVASAAAAVPTTDSFRAAIISIRPDGRDRQVLAMRDPPVYALHRSPDGKRIGFWRNDGTYIADLSGANEVRIAPQVVAFAFSPDGKRIAFIRDEGLYIADSSGANAVRVDSGRSPVAGIIAFSPDGKKIALYECGSCRFTPLRVLKVDGSGSEVLLSQEAAAASWSPGSGRLVFQSQDGIHVVTADGASDRRITRSESDDPQWSPRGNWIAYRAGRGGYLVPCVVKADGSHRRCRRGFSMVWRLLWSPDGRRLAFAQATPSRLVVVNADGSGLRRIKNGFRRLRPRPRPLVWSPDGHRLAFSYSPDLATPSQQIYVQPLDPAAPPRRVTSEERVMVFDDVRWRAGRISYVIFVQ
jgi:Tol biopolymer transport system component